MLLVDTVGELAALYASADVAFVGGSLVPVGGHNLLEPAALGVPVITGPFNANSEDVARLLLQSGGAVEVADAAGSPINCGDCSPIPRKGARTGARAREIVERHRGSVARLLELIEPLLAAPQPSGGAAAAGGESLSSSFSRFKLCSESMPAACCSLSTLIM